MDLEETERLDLTANDPAILLAIAVAGRRTHNYLLADLALEELLSRYGIDVRFVSELEGGNYARR